MTNDESEQLLELHTHLIENATYFYHYKCTVETAWSEDSSHVPVTYKNTVSLFGAVESDCSINNHKKYERLLDNTIFPAVRNTLMKKHGITEELANQATIVVDSLACIGSCSGKPNDENSG